MYRDTFKTIGGFQSYLRKGGEIPDIVKIGRITYTMDEYDLIGEHVWYGNLKHDRELTIKTKDRYTSKKDAIVSVDEMCSYRTNINYVE